MSHHYSGPDFTAPHGDARVDLCDLFAFPKPGDRTKSILIMDVHPSFNLNPPGPTTTDAFAADAIYEIKVDTDGDAIANIAYRIRFSPAENGRQTATVRRAEGAVAAGTGDGGDIIISAAPVSTGRETRVTESGDYRFFAGWRTDPFFFDAQGFMNNLQFTGNDFFADKDVCSIVLELPNRALGANGRVGLWQRTLVGSGNTGGDWVQVDRGARTQQATLVCPNEEKSEYLRGEPVDDTRFVNSFAHVLEHTGGYAPEQAKQVASSMLPDILPYDPTRPIKYPSNGRLLTDDVVDPLLAILTNGKVKADMVGPHTNLLPEFPYVGAPHRA